MNSKNTKNLDCFKCIFKKECIFNDLDAKTKKEWNNLKHTISCESGNLICKEKEEPTGIFVVCQGRVKIFTTDSRGQQMITWIRHPGKIAGHVSFFAETDYYGSAECMGKTTISKMDGKSFKKFLNAQPKLYHLLLKKLSTDIIELQENLKDTAYKPAKVKIANTLLKSISFKSKDTNSPTIHGLKRTEIAEITGLALETVVRALAALEKCKIIKREAKSIKILNLPELNKISDTHL
jgi:CRP-like cAMP-binding protein